MARRRRRVGATVIEDFPGVLRDAQQGSGAAFEVLWREWARPVATFLRARGVSDVDDVTSEVFVAVFTGLRRFIGDERQFRAWVFTIARRRVVDEYRSRGRRVQEEELLESHASVHRAPSAETTAIATLGEEGVHRLLASLTDDQRDVLLLRVVGDLTAEQVAEVMGKRLGAVKALQRRGLDALRRQLADQGVPL